MQKLLEVSNIAEYRSNYSQQLSPGLKWFTESQLEEIHGSTVDVLERAGVRVDHDEALKHFRSEIWSPTVFNRTMYEAWEKMGSKDVFQPVREKAEAILKNKPANTLIPEVVNKTSGLL